MSGTVALPWSFRASSLITLGSGVPFTVFDDSTDPFTVRWNEGRPAKDDSSSRTRSRIGASICASNGTRRRSPRG